MAKQSLINKALMEVAWIQANLSHARKRKVGAVLVRDERILATGRNGTPSGYDNNCEDGFPQLSGDGKVEGFHLTTKPEVLHAEENILMFAAKNGIAVNGATMYITRSPCFGCSRLIIQAGITTVYYDHLSSHIEAVEFLEENNITVGKL